MDHAAIYLEAAELYLLDTARGRFYSARQSDLFLTDLTRLVNEDIVKARVSAAVAMILEEFEERKRSGDLRAVNRNYREIRLNKANGQKIHSYRGYINTLIREALVHHARVHREELVK